MSSIEDCRMRALLSRRNCSMRSGPTRAACASETCRAVKSESVMMSPFTLATTRSMISAGKGGASSSGLRRAISNFHGFMVHLGSGQQLLDEATHGPIGILALQQRPDLVAAFVELACARRLARVDAQYVIAERT